MCIICVADPYKEIPLTTLKNCWRENPDGAGFSYVKNNKLFVCKGFMSFKVFYKEYLKLNSPYVLHFRKASTGTVINKESTHPFISHNNQLALYYNGTIRMLIGVKDKASDTQVLSEIVNEIPLDTLFTQELYELIYPIIGSNKLVYHTNKQLIILNMKLGIDYDGVWYSNESFKKECVTTITYTNPSSIINKTIYTDDITKCLICGCELTQYDIDNDIVHCIKCATGINNIPTERQSYCDNCDDIVDKKELSSGLCKRCVIAFYGA